jgi:hypothetical protein
MLAARRRGEQVRILLVALMAGFQLATCTGVHAHGDDKPKRGGTMGRGDDSVSIELVMEQGVIALYVEEHANHAPISSERMKGWLSLVARGRAAKEVRLVPAGANKLTAPGLEPVAGERLRARIILPNGDEVSSVFLFR